MAPVSLKGYLILDKIREGSVGTVWRAVDSSKKEFALKQLALRYAKDSSKLRSFEREATLTRKLSHPQIIRVYDYVDSTPQPFFVMEYFESENLKHALAHQPERVSKNEFRILKDIAEALAYVHGQSIVHKDVKPENILINERAEIRLIDFSLAQTRWDRILQFGRKVEGTPLYMSPEQIRGERCDPRTDLYSFGVMMYELLAKRPLFPAEKQDDLLKRHLHQAPVPLSAHQPTVSAELDAFVMRLLAKKPEQRPSDMGVVLQELSRWTERDTGLRMRQINPSPLRYSEGGPSARPQ